MSHRPQAVLAGYLIGLAGVGVVLPRVVRLIADATSAAYDLLEIPSNPGESGYLAVALNWIPEILLAAVAAIFSVQWLLTNAPWLSLFVFSVLLLRASPGWFLGLIERTLA
jgi:hypothetical protein